MLISVLGGWGLSVGGVKADRLSGVDGGVVIVCWGSTKASGGGGGGSGIAQDGVLTADSGYVAGAELCWGSSSGNCACWALARGGFWSWLIGGWSSGQALAYGG